MEDLDRRLLLGAAGIAGVAAFAGRSSAGPLNPPAGAVGSTGRTLDEVYNKIAPPGGADGRTPIPGGSSPYTITQGGSYVLTGSITLPSGGNAIIINVPAGADVAIDLNGFSINGSTDTSQGIIGTGNVPASITIRNGTFNGHVNAILVGNGTLLFEDLVFTRARWKAISILGTGGCHAVVRRCMIVRTGEATASNDNIDVRAIEFTGCSGVVEDCVIDLVTHANPARAKVGIYQSGGTAIVIRRNAVNAAGIGIRTDSSATIVYRDNTVTATFNAYSTTGATNGGGNV
ncbi:MAG: hypothetical protein QM783_09685 [Phycisphaerales bacterium]